MDMQITDARLDPSRVELSRARSSQLERTESIIAVEAQYIYRSSLLFAASRQAELIDSQAS